MQNLIEAIKELGTPTILDWTPVFLSVIAICVAVYVPVRIAKKQNRIAIFDKAFDSYSQLKLVRSFADAIENNNYSCDSQEAHRLRALTFVHFESSFGYRPDINDFEVSIGKALSVLRINETKAHMLPFLVFRGEEKDKCDQMITAIYEPLFSLMTGLILFDQSRANGEDDSLKEFVKATETFFGSYAERIEKTLQL